MSRRRAEHEDAGEPQPAAAGAPPTRRWKLALVGVAILFALASPLWAPLLLRRLAFFRVRRVEIVGAHYIPPGDILGRLRVDTLASVWDPKAPLERRVAAHPEVERVSIDRRLPGTLVVHVTERTPVALVPGPRGLVAYDARAVALPIDPARTPVDAPIATIADTTVLRLLAALRTRVPALYDRLSEVRRPAGAGGGVGNGAGDELVLQLVDFPVRVMKNVTVERLADIEPVASDLARRQLKVAELDLRFRDQVIARLE